MDWWLRMTRMTVSIPEAAASSTANWMRGLPATGSISLGIALVAGSMRVPKPAAGITALRTFLLADMADARKDYGRKKLSLQRATADYGGQSLLGLRRRPL